MKRKKRPEPKKSIILVDESVKTINFTSHNRIRLPQKRQDGVTAKDIVRVAKRIPGTIDKAMKFRENISAAGRVFDIVVRDTEDGRLVLTVIGRNWTNKGRFKL